MRVLGVDPGTLRLGVALLEETGSRLEAVSFETVKISKELPLPARLKQVYEAIQERIEKYSPEIVAIENVFFGKDVRALVKMGEARACAILAAEQKGIPVVEYPPARVKQAVSGNGRASKIQVQNMMQRILHLKTLPGEDAADALAVALCCVQSNHVRIPVG